MLWMILIIVSNHTITASKNISEVIANIYDLALDIIVSWLYDFRIFQIE